MTNMMNRHAEHDECLLEISTEIAIVMKFDKERSEKQKNHCLWWIVFQSWAPTPMPL